jgi:hypothetical protein
MKSTKDSSIRKKLDGERSEIKKQIAEAQDRIEHSAKARDKAVAAQTPKLVREIYLRTFSRPPSEKELTQAEQYVADSPTPFDGLRDLVWALANSKEFVVNH